MAHAPYLPYSRSYTKPRVIESCANTINPQELCGMIMTVCVVQIFTRKEATEREEPVRMRGDNASAVSRVNRYGASRDGRAGLITRMISRIEAATG